MKRLTLSLALVLAAVAVGAAAQESAARKNLLTGSEMTSPAADSVSFACRADGALPGNLIFTVIYERPMGRITGGEWTLRVTRPAEDGTPQEVGVLRGSFTGGGLRFGPDGKLASISAARMSIDGGEGEYAGVTGGGTLDGSMNPRSASPFGGSLALNF